MANEATVTVGLRIANLDYTRSKGYQVDVADEFGPSPGAILVAQVTGTDIDLSELGQPGLCWFHNQDANNPVRIGRWDPDNERFYPLLRLKAGEQFVLRLDYLVEEEFTGTGTGTTATASTLRAIAENADVRLLVEAFND